MAIGDRIHDLRTARNLTMEELGAKVGVGKGTIKKYESGLIKNIPSDKIESLAEALETTPEYLMGWTESEHEQQSQSPKGEPVYLKHDKVRVLAKGFDRMPAEKIMKALDLAKMVFSEYAEYFEEGADDDET